jgi:hypothetical protein
METAMSASRSTSGRWWNHLVKKICSNARNRSFSPINMVLYDEVKIQDIGDTGGELEINP